MYSSMRVHGVGDCRYRLQQGVHAVLPSCRVSVTGLHAGSVAQEQGRKRQVASRSRTVEYPRLFTCSWSARHDEKSI